MWEMTKYICFSLLLLLFLNGCIPSNNVSEDIFQFKDSYVGDNNTVGSIVRQLPNGEHSEGFELKTKEEPFGMVLKYGDIEATMIDDAIKETVIYNATFIFALVKNADWITFDFGEQKHTLTKEELQDWYGKELASYTNEEDLSKVTQEYLEDESKINQFFEK
ncbi:DUF4825 domain-containing protein [Halalkalibacter lacteus]|uniref:DUF4825 domain-containing protein n=1 Tax=Halalkalibacter lacteus TaxID=3090663 RepID=UPI002FCC108F